MCNGNVAFRDGKMIFSKIVGVGGYLPPKVVENSQIESMIGVENWIFERTGIRRRHIAEESVVEMGVKALNDAMKNGKIEKFDYLIVASNTSDTLIPGISGRIQRSFGEKIGGIDIQAGCSGFIQAMEIADSMIRSGSFSKIGIVGSEKLSGIIDFKDKSVGPLFGDGAGAILMERSDKPGIIANYSRIQGEGYESIIQRSGQMLQMDGKAVFRFAIEAIVEGIEEVLKKAELDIKDVDLFVPHQSNYRIIAKVAEKLNLSIDRFQISIEDHANTAAASVPLAIKDALDSGKIGKSSTVLTVGYGAGLGIAASIFKL